MLRQYPPEPWNSFFLEIDAAVAEKIELHCLGGFIVSVLYDLGRSTSDIDVIAISPRNESVRLIEMAGKGSDLHRRHGVFLDLVTIASVPDDYEQRLSGIFTEAFKHLRIFALDPYDIALAKLERNIQRDRDDVRCLARIIPFDLEVLNL